MLDIVSNAIVSCRYHVIFMDRLQGNLFLEYDLIEEIRTHSKLNIETFGA